MTRQEFSAKTKLSAFERAKGHCESCGQKIVSRAEYDHIVPAALAGEATLQNCAVLCRACHRSKTTTGDVPRISKAKRTYAKSIGAWRPRTTFKTSKWKKKISGEVVER